MLGRANLMRETFPQFIIYQDKVKFSYPDLNAILLIMINLRNTWNPSTFKVTTKRVWIIYHKRLNLIQKIVFQQAIVQLRKYVNDTVSQNNFLWLSKEFIVNFFETEVTPNIIDYNHRKRVFKSYVRSHPLP